MRKIWRAMVMGSLLLSAPSSALAWDDTGHMLVSYIAYNRLNPTARERVDKLVKTIRFCGKTYDGTTIGAWMDDIKADSMHDDLREWHYTNLPIFDGLPPDPKIKAADNNVATRLKWAEEMLRTGLGSDKKDAEALGFLFHLVGDAHQPLHGATRYTAANPKGDAGGNGFKLAGVPEAANLHWYWDSSAGAFEFWQAPRPLDDATRQRLGDYARAITAAYPADGKLAWQELNPDKWVAESHDLAQSVAYDLPENAPPTAAYKTTSQATARRRIALAGYRLAQLLNSIYPAK